MSRSKARELQRRGYNVEAAIGSAKQLKLTRESATLLVTAAMRSTQGEVAELLKRMTDKRDEAMAGAETRYMQSICDVLRRVVVARNERQSDESVMSFALGDLGKTAQCKGCYQHIATTLLATYAIASLGGASAEVLLCESCASERDAHFVKAVR